LGHAVLPAADQAGAHAELALTEFDAEAHKLPNQVVLGPTPKLAVSPQLSILHSTLLQDE
jgi:hypothetical protein